MGKIYYSGGLEMMERTADASPDPRARITGAVYLFFFVTAGFGELLVSRKLVVYGDAVSLISDACYVVVTLLFYEMFKPVHRGVSLVAALFSLVGCAITILDLFHLAPSHVSPLLFFGPYCLLLGYLIFRSSFLPRILGVLMMLAGLGWLVFLSPELAHALGTSIKVLGILAEGLLMLWLLVKGVNVRRWNQQASGMR
jgi:Domain of unknown function (DUF4386)